MKTVKQIQMVQPTHNRYYDIVIRQVAPGEAGANGLVDKGAYEVVVGYGELRDHQSSPVGLILKYKGDDLAKASAVCASLRSQKIADGYVERPH